MDFKCGKNLPPTHRSRDTAHAQWLQTHCQCYPMGYVRTHNSRTDSRKDLQTWWMDWPRDPPCTTTDQSQKVKCQGHEVT